MNSLTHILNPDGSKGESQMPNDWVVFEEPDEPVHECPYCCGTGLAWEGWDCEECDGMGYWEW